MQGAELVPEHLRRILTAPTADFKMISCAGVLDAIVRAIGLCKQSPRWLRRMMVARSALALFIVLAGYAP